MYATHILERINNIAREEGVKSLLKTSLNYFVKVSYLPYGLYKIRKFDSGGDLHKLLNFVFSFGNGLLKPLQVKSEILDLIKVLDNIKPKRILEIGTANGGTLFLFSRLAAIDAQIISIDLPGGRFGGGYPAWKKPLYMSFALPEQKIHLIREDSHKARTLEKIEALLCGNKLDLLFIDGDHTYEGAKKDFTRYASLVKDDGFIVMHDIVDPECVERRVHTFWHEIKSNYKPIEIVEDWNQGWAGIGLLKKTNKI